MKPLDKIKKKHETTLSEFIMYFSLYLQFSKAFVTELLKSVAFILKCKNGIIFCI